MAKTLKLTRSDFDKAASDYFEASHEISRIKAEKALKMQEIEKEYEDALKVATTKLEVSETTMTTYANENKDLLITTKSKTFEVNRVKGSFRSGTGKLVLLENFDWEKVLENAKKEIPDYVRQIDEIEKDKIIKDAKILAEKLATIGVKIEGGEDKLSFKLKD